MYPNDYEFDDFDDLLSFLHDDNPYKNRDHIIYNTQQEIDSGDYVTWDRQKTIDGYIETLMTFSGITITRRVDK